MKVKILFLLFVITINAKLFFNGVYDGTGSSSDPSELKPAKKGILPNLNFEAQLGTPYAAPCNWLTRDNGLVKFCLHNSTKTGSFDAGNVFVSGVYVTPGSVYTLDKKSSFVIEIQIRFSSDVTGTETTHYDTDINDYRLGLTFFTVVSVESGLTFGFGLSKNKVFAIQDGTTYSLLEPKRFSNVFHSLKHLADYVEGTEVKLKLEINSETKLVTWSVNNVIKTIGDITGSLPIPGFQKIRQTKYEQVSLGWPIVDRPLTSLKTYLPAFLPVVKWVDSKALDGNGIVVNASNALAGLENVLIPDPHQAKYPLPNHGDLHFNSQYFSTIRRWKVYSE